MKNPLNTLTGAYIVTVCSGEICSRYKTCIGYDAENDHADVNPCITAE